MGFVGEGGTVVVKISGVVCTNFIANPILSVKIKLSHSVSFNTPLIAFGKYLICLLGLSSQLQLATLPHENLFPLLHDTSIIAVTLVLSEQFNSRSAEIGQSSEEMAV